MVNVCTCIVINFVIVVLLLLFVVQVDESVDVTVLATYTPGCSGSDIREVIIVDPVL